jgi:hypothetical protein
MCEVSAELNAKALRYQLAEQIDFGLIDCRFACMSEHDGNFGECGARAKLANLN